MQLQTIAKNLLKQIAREGGGTTGEDLCSRCSYGKSQPRARIARSAASISSGELSSPGVKRAYEVR